MWMHDVSSHAVTKGRLEAFSDGVMAVLITIMVLELRVPEGADWAALRPILPAVLSYVLSFVFLGIYWNNHHHLLHAADRVNGGILWANLHLFFWLSLVPFATAWVGHYHDAALPSAAYGGVLLMAAIAYIILQRAIIRHHGPQSRLAEAVGNDGKGWLSLAAYATAIPLAFVNQWISDTLYVLVVLMWLVPDRRIESKFKSEQHA
jgi:TMEM175 potassium channel family protein